MKILVTGGCGFIGSNFIRYWLKYHPEDRIVNLDLLTYAGNKDNLNEFIRDPRYSFIRGDIRNKEDVDKGVKGIEWIIHFAAESHVDRSISSAAAFVETNIMGTRMLLDAALKYKVLRFHHISTDEVFGSLALKSRDKFNENTPYNPRSPYAASKASSDHLVRSYFYTHGLNITISNCSNNFGPYQHPEKLIPLAIIRLMQDSKVPLYGDGLNVRDWLYVEDHCRAIDMILYKGRPGETYCVGGLAGDISNIDLLRKITSLMGKNGKDIVKARDRKGHDRRYAIDWTKINKELGWKPLFDFSTRLNETVNWYRANRSWWEKTVKGKNFISYFEKNYPEIR